MGKSDKKVKSDRINALRKQYDAFLEDDKKRKERNEYILEKLDKMRYCTAMVPVRQKAPYIIGGRKVTTYNMPDSILDCSTELSHMNIDSPRKTVDETNILQEISKKYILIPKLRPPYGNDNTKNIKPTLDENTDWKSKYEILDQLKKDEKEQESSLHADTSAPNVGDISNTYLTDKDIKIDNEPLLEYKHELPVKLPPEVQIPYDLQQFSQDNTGMEQNYPYDNLVDNANPNKDSDIMSEPMYDSNLQNMRYGDNGVSNIHSEVDPQHRINDQYIIDNPINHRPSLENVIYDEIPSKDYTENSIATQDDNTNYDDQYFPNNESMRESVQLLEINKTANADTPSEVYLQEANLTINDNGKPMTQTDESNNEEVVLREELNNNIETNKQANIDQAPAQEIASAIASSMIPNTYNENIPENDALVLDSNIEYPIETINVQDFTPHDGVQLKDNVNINPEPQAFDSTDLTQQYDPAIEPQNIDMTGETFVAEQNDGMYPEQKENYDYTEEGVTDYVPQAKNYEQNEEYAYYEGAQPEQPYTEVVNDNEEVTQQYDQNYEQQYGTAYNEQGYEQGYQQEYAQGYDQQGYTESQQYETEQPQQDLQYENPDNISPEYVEQQLDNEEGYVENAVEKSEEVNLGSQQVPAAMEQESKVQ